MLQRSTRSGSAPASDELDGSRFARWSAHPQQLARLTSRDVLPTRSANSCWERWFLLLCGDDKAGLIRRICALQTIVKRRRRTPAKLVETADVEQLARRAVGTRGVETDFAAVTDDLGDHAGELGDGDVLAGADIDQLRLRIGLHQMHAGIRHVVDIEELAPRRPGAPHDDALGARNLRLVKRRIRAATTWL